MLQSTMILFPFYNHYTAYAYLLFFVFRAWVRVCVENSVDVHWEIPLALPCGLRSEDRSSVYAHFQAIFSPKHQNVFLECKL